MRFLTYGEDFNWVEVPRRQDMIYCTSYCNHGHRLSDGLPVDHECRVIPPKALEAERAGEYETAVEILKATKFRWHKGVKS